MDFQPLQNWVNLPAGQCLLVSGPCGAESREQVLETAKGLKETGKVQVFRSGVWKPRTRPGHFEGKGEEALGWLKEVKAQFGFLTAVEVASASHVEQALKHSVDILWIGA